MFGAIFDMDGTPPDSMPLWDNFGALYLASPGIEGRADFSRPLFPMAATKAAERSYALPLTAAEIADGVRNTCLRTANPRFYDFAAFAANALK
jgi:beta-phosphoglucomutase-like phosphatase (HAD superfamily)